MDDLKEYADQIEKDKGLEWKKLRNARIALVKKISSYNYKQKHRHWRQ